MTMLLPSSWFDVFLFAALQSLSLYSKAVYVSNKGSTVRENADPAPLKEIRLFGQQFEARVQYVLCSLSRGGGIIEGLRNAKGRLPFMKHKFVHK